jgi:hypothetical protein
MSWETFYNWPISYRRWTIKKLNEELSKNKDQTTPSRAHAHNDPETRQLMGKRAFAPHNMKR